MDKSRILAKLLLEYKSEASEILSQLRLFEEAMNEGLYKLMLNPVIDFTKKKTIVEKLFKYNLSEEMIGFVVFLIKDDQLKYLGKIVGRYEKLAKQKKGLEMVEIVSARELTDLQITQIKEKIRKVFKIEPIINTTIDEMALAGMSIKVGDRVFDNTIDKQINDLYKSLVG